MLLNELLIPNNLETQAKNIDIVFIFFSPQQQKIVTPPGIFLVL